MSRTYCNFLSLIFLFGCNLVNAQGVRFSTQNIQQTFDQARAKNKIVFVEVYSNSCHHCQEFEPVFSQKQTGDFYNQQFLSFKLETGSPELRPFLQTQRLILTETPTFLFLDGSQNLLHVSTIATTKAIVAEVIKMGQQALNPATRSASLLSRFQAGDHSSVLLRDLALYSRMRADTVTNLKAMELYARSQPESKYLEEVNFSVLQKLILDIDNPMARYLIGHLSAYNKKYTQEMVKTTAENILMFSLNSSRGNKYSSAKIIQIGEELRKAGVEAKPSRNRIFLPLLNAYFREKKTQQAVTLLNEQRSRATFGAPDYTYLIRLFNRKSPDPGYVTAAVEWHADAVASLNGRKGKALSDLDYEMAVAYQRAGKKQLAREAAQRALSSARADGSDATAIEKLLKTI